MSTFRHSGHHRARRRHRRRMERYYYRTPNPRLETVKRVAIAVFVVVSIGFLIWAFLFYK